MASSSLQSISSGSVQTGEKGKTNGLNGDFRTLAGANPESSLNYHQLLNTATVFLKPFYFLCILKYKTPIFESIPQGLKVRYIE